MRTSVSTFIPFRKKPAAGIPPSLPGGRWGVLVTFVAGALLLADYMLETTFVPAMIYSIDASSGRVVTERGAFLAEFADKGGAYMEVGDVIVLEQSRISKSVVAYQPQDSLFVYNPREVILDYWFLAAIVCALSVFLFVRWNQTEHRFELLTVNLIILVILGVLYFVSR